MTGPLAWWLECSPMVRESKVQSQVKSYQRLKTRYLMLPCLSLSIIRCGSRVKWNNRGNAVAPSPTPWCSSYWKGSLRVTLDYGRQLYLNVLILTVFPLLSGKRWRFWSELFLLRIKLLTCNEISVTNLVSVRVKLAITTTYVYVYVHSYI